MIIALEKVDLKLITELKVFINVIILQIIRFLMRCICHGSCITIRMEKVLA